VNIISIPERAAQKLGLLMRCRNAPLHGLVAFSCPIEDSAGLRFALCAAGADVSIACGPGFVLMPPRR
jgi:hypothetical protein